VKATKVNAGLAESNGRLLLGIWRDSLHVTCGLTACTLGSAPGPTLANEYEKTLLFYLLLVICSLNRVIRVMMKRCSISHGRKPDTCSWAQSCNTCIHCLLAYLSLLLTYFLPYISAPLRIDPFHFQAGCRKRWLNLALVFYVYFLLVLCLQCFDAVGWVSGSAAGL